MHWRDGKRMSVVCDHDGAAKGGGRITAAPCDGRRPGLLIARMRPPLDPMTPWGMGGRADLAYFLQRNRVSHRAVSRQKAAGMPSGRPSLASGRVPPVGGNALPAQLPKEAAATRIQIWRGSPATALRPEAGRVTSAGLMRAGALLAVAARRGVSLTAGRARHLPAANRGHREFARAMRHRCPDQHHHLPASQSSLK